MDLGGVLREARERRGLSLDALSRATKINVSTLRTLEASQFDRVAHGIFVRGFLRAYAHEVGLDADEIINRYRAEYDPADTAANDSPRPIATFPAHEPIGDESDTRQTVVMLIALVAIAVAGYVIVQRANAPAPAEPPQTEEATREVVPASVATAGPESPVASATAAPAPAVATTAAQSPDVAAPQAAIPAVPATGGVRFEFRTTDDCWIEATADGMRVAFGIVAEGQARTFEARDTLVLRLGQPSALTYTINGSPGRPLGPSGQPVTVRITPANYREFIVQ
jgi:cytoskeleton protein RodZ